MLDARNLTVTAGADDQTRVRRGRRGCAVAEVRQFLHSSHLP